MKLLSDLSHQRLIERNEILAARNKVLQARCRALENSYTELQLECGLRGFAVEVAPPVPAKPARIVLRRAMGYGMAVPKR